MLLDHTLYPPSLWLELLQRLLMLEVSDLQGTLHQTANVLADAFDSDKIDVFLAHPEQEILIAYGTSNTPMGRLQREIGLHRLAFENGGRAVQVFQSGASYLTGHADQDPLELAGIKWDLGVRSMMLVPLLVNGVRRGVLLVSSATPDYYSEEHLRFLQTVTKWVGDVTHRAELTEQHEKLLVAQARQGVAEELLTVVAHDIKNFITPLALRLMVMRRRAHDEQRHQDESHVVEAEHTLRYFRSLIDTLLDVTRLDHGLFGIERIDTHLNTLMAETVDMLRLSEVEITLNMPDDITAAIDPLRFQLVLTNLISNAIQHGGAPEGITVNLHHSYHEVEVWMVITVEDRGQGIDVEALPQLFERYWTGRQSAGLGLGLYLAKQIVEAHGGTLTVDSHAASGTCFRIEMPTQTPIKHVV
jgi:two-component system OmpR family sensor kinase